MFEHYQEGDSVKVCRLGLRGQRICSDALIDKVTETIEVKFLVDGSRTLEFNRSTGRLINSDEYWLEKI